MSAELRDKLDEAQETIRLLTEQLVPQAFWMWMPREWASSRRRCHCT